MGSQALAHMILQFTRQRMVRRKTFPEYDESLDDLGALRIRRPHHGCHAYCGMAEQAVLDGAGTDAIAGAGDHVVVAADEGYVAVRVLRPGIAGDEPVAYELVLRGLAVVPVAEEHDRVGATHGDRADLARRQNAAGVIDDLDIVSGCRFSDGAGFRWEQGFAG